MLSGRRVLLCSTNFIHVHWNGSCIRLAVWKAVQNLERSCPPWVYDASLALWRSRFYYMKAKNIWYIQWLLQLLTTNRKMNSSNWNDYNVVTSTTCRCCYYLPVLLAFFVIATCHYESLLFKSTTSYSAAS